MTTVQVWPTRFLGSLVDVLDSQRVPVSAAERAKRPGDVPYYGASSRVGYIDSSIFNEELVLLGEDGVQFFEPGRQKAYRITGPSWVNNHAHVLRARSELHQRFLEHYLNQFDYRGYANGTTRLKLTQAAMKTIPVPLPPLAEQRRIVDILEDHLSRLDAADGAVGFAMRRSTLLKASLLTSTLPDGVGKATLGSLALSSDYGTSTKCVVGGPGPAVVRIPNIVNGRIDLKNEKRVASATVDVTSSMLSVGDLLIIRTNGSRGLIGRAAVVQDGVEAAFASYLIRYRLDPQRVRPEWIALSLGVPRTRTVLERMAASSAGQYNLSLSKLDSLGLPVPTLEEQDRLIAKQAEHDYREQRLRAATADAQRRAASLRRALLSAAFSGKLTGAASDSDIIEELAG